MTKRNKAVPGTRQELGALADAAKGAADRAGTTIDDAMASITASNKRIAGMESAAAKSSKNGRLAAEKRIGVAALISLLKNPPKPNTNMATLMDLPDFPARKGH